MNPQQKESIYILSLAGLSLIVFGIISYLKSQASFSAFAIFGLAGLVPILFHRKSKKNGNEVVLDERDKEIAEKAGKSGFGAFWTVFILVVVILPIIKGYNSSIPVDFLNKFLTIGVIIIFSVRAIKILWLYRQDSN